MTTRLSFLNQKGGVGKTTLAINTAGALSARGRDVLLVDLDPQGNATEALGFPEVYDAEGFSLRDVLLDPSKRDQVTNIVYTHTEMKLLPSNLDMTMIEPELYQQSHRPTEELSLTLDVLESELDLDYIIVDCPPNFGVLTDNAIYGTQRIVIPALAQSTSKRALELLMDQVESIEASFQTDVEIVALLANCVKPNNESDMMTEWFEAALSNIPIYEIRDRVDLQRGFSGGGSLFETCPELDMREIFEEIAADLDERYHPEAEDLSGEENSTAKPAGSASTEDSEGSLTGEVASVEGESTGTDETL